MNQFNKRRHKNNLSSQPVTSRLSSSILEACPAAMFVLASTQISYANPAAARLAGLPLEKLPGLDFSELVFEEDKKTVTPQLETARSQVSADLDPAIVLALFRFRLLKQDGDGTYTWVEAICSNLRTQEKPALLLTVSELNHGVQEELNHTQETLTEQNHVLINTQKDLELERWRYKEMFELAPDGYLMTNLAGVIREANQAVSRLFRHPVDYIIGKSLAIMIIAKERPRFRRLLRDIVSPGWLSQHPYEIWEFWIKPNQLEPFAASITVAPMTEKDKPVGLRWNVRDATQHLRNEETIRHHAAQVETLLRTASRLNSGLDLEAVVETICEETIAALNMDGASISLFDPHRKLFYTAYDCGLPEGFMDVIPNTGFDDFNDLLQKNGAVIVLDSPERIASAPNGEAYLSKGVRTLVCSSMKRDGDIVGGIYVFSLKAERRFSEDEITLLKGLADQAALAIANSQLYQELESALEHEKATHDQLVVAEKQVALGRLVGSFAHELNNPIQTIQNCLYLSQSMVKADSETFQYLEMASTEARRISKLITLLRQTYRPSQLQAEQPIDLAQIIEEVHKLLESHLLQQQVEWRQKTGIGPMMARGNSDQIKQVFLNIALNSIEAMQPEGGLLEVDLFRHQEMKGETRLGVAFTDHGPGIDPADRDKIFEPFFTTKEGGVGLGLTISYDIVQRHGGDITVESKPGNGSRFTVWLPMLGS